MPTIMKATLLGSGTEEAAMAIGEPGKVRASSVGVVGGTPRVMVVTVYPDS
jgi:hypothetical protein